MTQNKTVAKKPARKKPVRKKPVVKTQNLNGNKPNVSIEPKILAYLMDSTNYINIKYL